MIAQAIRPSYGVVTALVIVDGEWLAITAGDIYYRGGEAYHDRGGGGVFYPDPFKKMIHK